MSLKRIWKGLSSPICWIEAFSSKEICWMNLIDSQTSLNSQHSFKKELSFLKIFSFKGANGNIKISKFTMAFAIRRRTPPPFMTQIYIHFLTHFFSFTIESYICMKRILHLVSVKNIMSKFSYNWFKIDILRLLRPLTAIFSHVHGHLNYYTW